jgi:hypothetical protein
LRLSRELSVRQDGAARDLPAKDRVSTPESNPYNRLSVEPPFSGVLARRLPDRLINIAKSKPEP